MGWDEPPIFSPMNGGLKEELPPSPCLVQCFFWGIQPRGRSDVKRQGSSAQSFSEAANTVMERELPNALPVTTGEEEEGEERKEGLVGTADSNPAEPSVWGLPKPPLQQATPPFC